MSLEKDLEHVLTRRDNSGSQDLRSAAATDAKGSAHFTKGPWRAEQQTRHGAAVYIYAAGNEWSPIAEHVNGFDNARLIAAAPDLLAALKGLVDAEHQFAVDTGLSADDAISDAVKASYAAIAKAEGR